MNEKKNDLTSTIIDKGYKISIIFLKILGHLLLFTLSFFISFFRAIIKDKE